MLVWGDEDASARALRDSGVCAAPVTYKRQDWNFTVVDVVRSEAELGLAGHTKRR
jgi:hypothetical protein